MSVGVQPATRQHTGFGRADDQCVAVDRDGQAELVLVIGIQRNQFRRFSQDRLGVDRSGAEQGAQQQVMGKATHGALGFSIQSYSPSGAAADPAHPRLVRV